MTSFPAGLANAGNPDKTFGRATGIVGVAASVGLGMMVLLPLLDKLLGPIELRSESWVQNLTLWVGLFGAFLASWKEKHLCIAVGEAIRSAGWKARFDVVSRAGTVGILL